MVTDAYGNSFDFKAPTGPPEPATGTQPVIPEHIRAAIHAGHVAQVVIFCDGCGTVWEGDCTGDSKEVRFAAARRHLNDNGWRCGKNGDDCPACLAGDTTDTQQQSAEYNALNTFLTANGFSELRDPDGTTWDDVSGLMVLWDAHHDVVVVRVEKSLSPLAEFSQGDPRLVARVRDALTEAGRATRAVR